jgi:hypothetical protein
MTPGQAAPPDPHDLPAQRSQGYQDRRLDALSGFQEAAEAAMSAWRQELTTGQGMSAVWMLRSIITDFRVAASLLGGSRKTGSPAVPDAPVEQIALAAGCLDSADGVLARTGQPAAGAAIAANLARGAGAGGDPSKDGPAVTAAHAMHNAMGVRAGIWRQPAGSAEIRDEIVTQMMVAVDMLATAALTLASGAPAPYDASLTTAAGNLDACCRHLRESVICSATGNYQPGSEEAARDLRTAYPLLSEVPGTPLSTASGPGNGAPAVAATDFPRPAADATAAGTSPPGPVIGTGNTALRHPHTERPASARRNP